MNNQTPSLARRYAAKLGTNLFGMVFNFVNVSLIPRSLGPVAYGNFEFLLNFFQQITGFIDTGTSTAFYNKLSQRNEDLGLIRTEGKFVIIVFFVMLAGLAIVWQFGWQSKIWPKQEWEFILLAALLGYLAWVCEVFRKVVDAFGCTIRGEITMVAARAAGVVATVILFLCSWLSLTNQFLKELIFYGVLIIILAWIVIRHWKKQLNTHSYSSSDRVVIAELWRYCSPLIVYALAGVITGLADRWLLQKYAGSEEQGFYALSFRVAGVSLVFTAAMTQLIMREYSRYHSQGNFEQMRRLFRRYVPMLYTLAAYFAAFISMQAETVVWILGGNNFVEAGPAMMLMALYPVHQTYGQMNAALLMATEKTRLYRNIGVMAMLTGLIATWFLLAPSDKGGLNAGSMGLSVKMVLIQFFAVNVQLWFNLKSLKLRFRYFFLRQIAVVTVLLLMAWLATTVVGMINLSRISGFIVAGIMYSTLVGLFVFKFPLSMGVNRAEFNALVKKRLKIV